jgi:thymidine phosphorylase
MAGTVGNVYNGVQQQQALKQQQAQGALTSQQNAENFRRLIELFGGDRTQPVRPPNG